MRFSAQTFLKSWVFSVCSLVFVLLSLFLPTTVAAQSYQTTYVQPNVDPGVPQDQHTFVQSTIIELLDFTYCALSGEDAINPQQGCLSLDLRTHKLTYAPTSTSDNQATGQQMGGLIGLTSNMIGTIYTPTTSSALYFQTVASNFGIVQPAYAAPSSCLSSHPLWGYGYCGLQPMLHAWETMRDIAYLLLILVFVLIGLGIMLRVKIDPRTVMTIQNQIPRVIIAILLITFSYAIAAIMIDAMWFVTYVGINAMTALSNPSTGNGTSLAQNGTQFLIETPLTYVNNVFHTQDATGIFHISNAVSFEVQAIIHDLFSQLFGNPSSSCHWYNPLSYGDCILAGVVNIFSWIALIIAELVVLIAILILLFRVWWNLLKAYIFVLVSVITSPIWIVMGLLPSKPLGFEKWMRTIFSNLAVFPATVFLFVLARIFEDMFQNAPSPQDQFIPPLIGNPNANNFGALVAFGVILMTPTLLDQIHQLMKTPKSGAGAAVLGGIRAGAAVPGAIGKYTTRRLWRPYNHQTGEEAGVLRNWVAGNDPNSRRYRIVRQMIGGLSGQARTRH